MKSLIPLSALKRGDSFLPASAASFAPLKRCFKFNETTGKNFSDAIAGTILVSNGTPTFTTYGVVPAASAGTISGAALPATIGTSKFLLVVVGKFGANSFQLGAAGAGNARVQVNQAAGVIYDGATPYGPAAGYTNDSAVVWGRAVGVKTYNAVGGIVGYESDGTTATAIAAGDATGLTTMPALSAGWVSNAAELLLAELWVFAGNLPTDAFIKAAIAQTVRMASAGYKEPNPMWQGVA